MTTSTSPTDTGAASGPTDGGQLDSAELHRRMSYHPATGDQPGIYQELREKFLALGEHVLDRLPFGEQVKNAIEHLEAALMWACKGVAVNGIGADRSAQQGYADFSRGDGGQQPADATTGEDNDTPASDDQPANAPAPEGTQHATGDPDSVTEQDSTR